jgi:hypothetical protein
MQILTAPPQDESNYFVVHSSDLNYRTALFDQIAMQKRVVVTQLLRDEAEKLESELLGVQYELRALATPCVPGFKAANQVFRVFFDPSA